MESSRQLIERYLPAIRKRVRIANDELFFIDEFPYHVSYDNPYLWRNLSNSGGFETLSTPVEMVLLFIERLTEHLYLRLFCGLNHEKQTKPHYLLKERHQFMHRLSAVNASSNAPDIGWEADKQKTDSRGFAHKNGIVRPLVPGGFVKKEGTVDFLRVAEDLTFEPDYYHAYSNAYLAENQELYRIYWNLKPEGAAPLLKALTEEFNFYRIPFRFKCLNHPALYRQHNTAILFINKNDLKLVSMLLRPIVVQLLAALNEAAPMFCEPIYAGVGLAEDPGISNSYGMFMMRQVAQILMNEHEMFQNNVGSTVWPLEPDAFNKKRPFMSIASHA